MDPITTLVLTLCIVAVGFYVLFLVVRAAILSALRQHAEEQSAPADATSHAGRPSDR
ncbi:hypothetical protein GCM10022240_05250 [Microbacterium kribbense]|uniref:CcmD family protein n=1 Tax=Microbacterium kribbense TaxID=433645 RepID=A0ABP7G4Y5_9MICO